MSERLFRVGRGVVPWEMLSDHEPQAIENHHQTLEQLSARGGLSVFEALAILDNCSWRTSEWRGAVFADAERELARRVDEWRAKNGVFAREAGARRAKEIVERLRELANQREEDRLAFIVFSNGDVSNSDQHATSERLRGRAEATREAAEAIEREFAAKEDVKR